MRWILILFLGLVLTACGDDTEPKGTEDNLPTADAGTEDATQPDAEPEQLCPNDYEKICGGFCLDVRYDNNNCGGCGVICPNETMACNEGACECRDDDLRMCDGLCRDTEISRDHCGSCGKVCPSSDACIAGECVLISEIAEIVGVLEETNARRSETQDCGEHGIKRAVGPLQLNEVLNQAAQKHSEDMARNNFMAHQGSDGSSPGQRAAEAGYTSGTIGENVAEGYTTPAAVVQGWTDSDGHCQNMMNGRYTELGVGYAISDSGRAYWTQLFGRP